MPPLSLLLLHEIFPSFPPLWAFLAAGLVIGAVITTIAGRHARRRTPIITTLSGANRPPIERGRVASSPTPSRLAAVRARMGGEILGIPWSIPGYSLAVVLIGGLASLVVPVAAIVVAPGFLLAMAVMFRAHDVPRGVEDVLFYLLIVVGSWLFWTVCAAIVWRLKGAVRGAPGTAAAPRLDIGKKG